MALQKNNVPINFAKGLDTKTDPLQVQPGNFAALQNTIFDKMGRLTKRNGFGKLAALPDNRSTIATTFNGNLTAVGNVLRAYSQGSATWIDKGDLQPVNLSVIPINRSSTNNTQADSIVASNGLACTIFTDQVPNGSGGVDTIYKYTVTDSVTTQNIIPPTEVQPLAGTIQYPPRVFMLGRYFIMLFITLDSGTNRLQYVAMNYNNPDMGTNTAVTLSSVVTPSSQLNYDAYSYGNSLYIAFNGSDVGNAVRTTRLDSTLLQGPTTVFATEKADIMSVTVDGSGSTPVMYATYFRNDTSVGRILAVNQQMTQVLAPKNWITATSVLNIAAAAVPGSNAVFYEIANNYGYDGSIATHNIGLTNVTQAGAVQPQGVRIRSVGLASKAFVIADMIYFLTIYQSDYQPTYFLMNGLGDVVCKLAYSNGGQYYTHGLPNVTLSGNVAQIPYLRKDLAVAINRAQDAVNTMPIYTQTGINLAKFVIGTSDIHTAEIGDNLLLSGGFIWAYDGFKPVEQGFHLWPDYVEVTTAVTGGTITAQDYFYTAVYAWTDAQGNIHRSAPAIFADITTTGTTSANTVYVPTMRLTYKIENPIRIEIYRSSTAQETEYLVTSILIPVLNDTSIDYITYVDTQPDTAILGNTLLYTTGGVVENIAAPASSTLGLYKSRLFSVSAEDQNLVYFSKQVIEGTTVEMTDLFSIYIAPTTSAQQSTGGVKCLAPLDDKNIFFKKDAIYYNTGVGADNTGANNDFSDPTFITSTVGSENQQSIVFIPQGLMFQSDKGIWLLGRDLNTSYIGAPVEDFTLTAKVLSAVNVPGTNQVRFTLDSGVTLMYDYFYGQWGSFVNIPAVSATIYADLHTYIDSFGQVYQEKPSTYLDGSSPVLIKFTTSWLNLAGLQGFERAYFFYILAQYISPHTLTVQVAYDYNPSPTQSSIIQPDNFTPNWGKESVWGGGIGWGGPGNLEQWRVFLAQQKCQAFQLTITESYDGTKGQSPGAGFTMSGLDLTVGMKDGRPRLKASRSVG